jgi:hypothetical protein
MAPDELEQLKASLLSGLRIDPVDDDDAFDRHLLVAARIHRAAKLNQTVTGEGKGWVEFFTDYFPSGRSSAADARRLWKDWRVGLLKDGTPLERVVIAYNHPELHWKLDVHGALCINLESMRDDFEYAVERFTQALAADKRRAAVVRRRWKERTWTARPFQLLPQAPPRGSVATVKRERASR